MKATLPPLRIAFWLLVFLGTLPAFVYLGSTILAGARGQTSAQPVFFKAYYGLFFILVFVCIAWLAQQLNLWWGVLLGLPALFVGIYPALENFGSEKLVRGAVVAFDHDTCPQGWEPFSKANGRVLLGAGEGTQDDFGRPLSKRIRSHTGGEEVHQLTIPEMPKHNHNDGVFARLLQSDGNYTAQKFDYTGNEPNLHSSAAIVAQGEDKPHNIMPPFIVLTFCIKQ